MELTDTTILDDLVAADAYKFTITGHDGLTVSLQYEDEGGWHDYNNSESTEDWDGLVDMAEGRTRVKMSAPGLIYFNYNKSK